MNAGLLWLDDDKRRPFAQKVQRAADYYEEKYGRLPEMCLVNAHMIESEQQVGKIKVQPTKTVLRNHFWLGMRVQNEKKH